ncbi:MAG: methionine--tRNA ligase subunit beta [Candidatus Anstonellales archaeon]
MESVEFSDFAKIVLKTGKIISAEKVAGTDKLVRIEVDIGEEKRQLVAGIAKDYPAEKLVGKTIIVVANLKPKKVFGIESQGMLLAVQDEKGVSLLTTDREVRPGLNVL